MSTVFLRAMIVNAALTLTSATQVDWVQTARFKDGSTDLLKDMHPLRMEAMDSLPTDRTLEVDVSRTYQEVLGFGGAFTEAAAINWRLLSEADQEEVIRLYFAGPEDGGHGYSLGRVPINSCDFSPESYTFDDVAGDVELEHFDTSVQHDAAAVAVMAEKALSTKPKPSFAKLNPTWEGCCMGNRSTCQCGAPFFS